MYLCWGASHWSWAIIPFALVFFMALIYIGWFRICSSNWNGSSKRRACSPWCQQHREQCLTLSKCSINVLNDWANEWMDILSLRGRCSWLPQSWMDSEIHVEHDRNHEEPAYVLFLSTTWSCSRGVPWFWKSWIPMVQALILFGWKRPPLVYLWPMNFPSGDFIFTNEKVRRESVTNIINLRSRLESTIYWLCNLGINSVIPPGLRVSIH